jgi:hypothetical protein
MNVVGTAVTAFFAGIFLILIIGAVLTSLWVSWQASKSMKFLKSTLDGYEESRKKDLAEQRIIFETALKNLNGNAILEASKSTVKAVKRLEFIAQTLSELITSANETQDTPQEWLEEARAEEHAPQTQSRIGKSVYADLVNEAETEEAFARVVGDL